MDNNFKDVPKPEETDRELTDDELSSVSGGIGAHTLASGGATMSSGKGVAAQCPNGSYPGVGGVEGVKF